MITIGTMASIDYYLEGQEDNLGASQKAANRKGSYYEDGKAASDPLRRPLKAWGPAAKRLGLVPGTAVSSAQFTNSYLGFSPDGKHALGRYPKDIAAQEKKLAALNEKKKLRTERAEKAYAAALERSNGDHGAAALDEKVVRARATLEKTIDEIRSVEKKLERLRDLCVPEISREEQVAASKRIRSIELSIDKARDDANEAYRVALEKGFDKNAALLAPEVVEAKRRVEEGKAKLEEARNDPAYRRPGTDVVYSLPASVSVLWARLMADGRTADAKKIEELFEKSVQGSMERMAATCTTSAGRDVDGKRDGEPVECHWSSVMHFDARPDEFGVVSPMLHMHNTLFNMGRTKDGEWSAIRTEGMKEVQDAEAARVESDVVRGCIEMFGIVATPKLYADGTLGVDFGDGRRLDEMRERGEDVFLFGRSEQVKKNLANGVSASQKNRVGRAEKKEMTGQEFIDYQRGLLDGHGLSMETIKGDRVKMTVQTRMEVEREFHTNYLNTIKAWAEYERKNGWPNGKPDPFQGADARRYSKFLKTTNEKRKKPGGDKIPPRPKIPPGYPGHSEKAWREAVIGETQRRAEARYERASLKAAHIVETLTQTKVSFTETELRAEVARRLQFAPLDLTKSERKSLTPEKVMELTEREISRVCESVRAHATESTENGKKVFVSNILIEAEKKLASTTLPNLFKEDKRVLNTSQEKAVEFVKAFEKKQGFAFSKRQFDASVAILTGTTRASFVLGWAGSGKSTMMAATVAGLYELAGYKTVIASAPSNSAKDNLEKDAGTDSSYTPQRLLLDYSRDKLKLDSKSIIILDEVSLLDVRTAARLCEVVDETGARIIFSGDPAQLESVGAGNFLEMMQAVAQEKDAESPANRFIELNRDYKDAATIQRQKTTSGKQISALMQVGDFSAAIRQMRSEGMIETNKSREDAILRMVEEYSKTIDEGKRETPHFIRQYEEARRTGVDVERAHAEMVESISRSEKAFSKIVMLAETNADVKMLGATSRAALKKIGILGKEDRMIVGYDGELLPVAIGERLILREKLTSKNALNYEQKGFDLCKGTEMHVVGTRTAPDGSLILDALIVGENAKKVGRVEIRAEDFRGVGAAYARTTHLSQGGSWDVSLFLPSGTMTTANLLLVAQTRWKHATKLFATDEILKKMKEKVAKVTPRRNALDYDGIAEVDLNEAVEIVRKATKSEVNETGKEAVRRATDVFAGVLQPPASDLSDVAKKLQAVAKADKRDELVKALELGIVRGEAVGTKVSLLGVELPFRSKNVSRDKRNWLALSETEVFAYNKKTGRVEAHPIEAAGEARVNLAKRSTLQPKFAEAIRDAKKTEQTPAPVETAEKRVSSQTDIRGTLIETGKSHFKDVKGAKITPWAKIYCEDGSEVKVWGADIERAIRAAGVKPGDGVSLNGDATKTVSVFSATEKEGTERIEGVLVSPPDDGSPAVVKVGKKEVRVYGADAKAWEDLEGGERVELFEKRVERRDWKAEQIQARNMLNELKRKKVWEATEKAIADDRIFSRLQGVGVGQRVHAQDSEQDARRRALRLWTAGGDEHGAEAVVDWNACLGKGRRAWQEVGNLESLDNGKTRSEISCVAIHDDGERVYVAAALENSSGDIETAGSRILAFEKADLGLSAPVLPGASMRVLCSEEADKPKLIEGGDETAEVLNETYEKAERNEKERGVLVAQDEILATISEMTDAEKAEIIARADRAELAKPDAKTAESGFEKLTEVEKISSLLPPKPPKATKNPEPENEETKATESDADRLAREAIDRARKAAEEEAKSGSGEAAPTRIPVVAKSEDKEKAAREEIDRAELETRKRHAEEFAEKTRRELKEVANRSAEEAARALANARVDKERRETEAQAEAKRHESELEKARQKAILDAQEKADEAERLKIETERKERMAAMWTDLLENTDPTDREGMLNCLEKGADPHRSDKAFEVALGFYRAENDFEKIDELLAKCDPKNLERVEALLYNDANVLIATEIGVPADFILRSVGLNDAVLVHCIENGASVESAKLSGYDRGEILANLPGDSPEAKRLIKEMLNNGESDFDRRGADGSTFAERAEEMMDENEKAYENRDTLLFAKEASRSVGQSAPSGGYSHTPARAAGPRRR